MELKPPLTIEQQIQRLESHGMYIPNLDNAKHFLSAVNYYRFSGYALEFRKDVHCSDYIPGTDFETIAKIYEFDEGLRHILRKYIEKVEIYYKTKIAYKFSLAKCTKPPYNQHYLPSNYYRTDKIKALLKHVAAEELYFQDTAFVKHHIATYENQLPLWVLVEIITFSTLSRLYGCMFYSDQKAIADSVGTSARILKNNLQAMAILRNKCAHGTRLYNDTMSLPVAFTPEYLQRHQTLNIHTVFAYIVMLSKRLPDNANRTMLQNNIIHLVNEYKNYINLKLMGFPDNWQQLL